VKAVKWGIFAATIPQYEEPGEGDFHHIIMLVRNKDNFLQA
jgi:hypothetical protein